MHGVLKFNVGEVRLLLRRTKGAKLHRPIKEQLYEAKYHKNRKIKKNREGLPDENNIVRSRIPAALWLVADRGVYLMSNAFPGLMREGSDRLHVSAYAVGCDPDKDAAWLLEKNRLMGKGNSVIVLPVDAFESLLDGKGDSDTFVLDAASGHALGMK